MVADSPGCCALLCCIGNIVCLAFDAGLHDVILADGAVVHSDVPCPQGHSIPLFHLESLALVLIFIGLLNSFYHSFALISNLKFLVIQANLFRGQLAICFIGL